MKIIGSADPTWHLAGTPGTTCPETNLEPPIPKPSQNKIKHPHNFRSLREVETWQLSMSAFLNQLSTCKKAPPEKDPFHRLLMTLVRRKKLLHSHDMLLK